ncbi:MAG: hypothetical protein ACOX7J_01365 [Bacillota bacterium]|jgi:hypothetical protein
MKFQIKKTQIKDESDYKTLYIKKRLVDKIDKIAKENDTSWNNVVISMIESCLDDDEN